ncbi:hypothetical protein [Paenibacillus marinisediminis]
MAIQQSQTMDIRASKSKRIKRYALLLGVGLLMMLMTGCVPGDGSYSPADPAGFFWGIWHGWIAPISLIAQLFSDSWRLYEPFNSGWWYDFGFYVAIISGFGGISLSRKRKK